MKSFLAVNLLIWTIGLGFCYFDDPSLVVTTANSTSDKVSQRDVATEKHVTTLELAKLNADASEGQTCEQLADAADKRSELTELPNAEIAGIAGKRVTVSSLVSRALTDQMQLLVARQNELDRWNPADQSHFANWFGTTSSGARELIYERIRVLTLLNKEYTVENFRRAVPSRPGLFAFVRPTDPSRIFVDRAFVAAPLMGENSRPGTITHEMSHFTLAGGTKDISYGVRNCKRLARQNPGQALVNADNFEFFVENVR